MDAIYIGVSEEDIAAFVRWLEIHGCVIESISDDYIIYETDAVPATKYHSTRRIQGDTYLGKVAVHTRTHGVALYSVETFIKEFITVG